MKRGCFILAGLLLAAAAGCGNKEPAAELQSTFKASPASPQKTLADEAIAAMQKQEYPKAVMNLQTLRTDPSLSVDQAIAVQNMMGKVQMEIATRAEHGDPQAQATMEMLRMRGRR